MPAFSSISGQKSAENLKKTVVLLSSMHDCNLTKSDQIRQSIRLCNGLSLMSDMSDEKKKISAWVSCDLLDNVLQAGCQNYTDAVVTGLTLIVDQMKVRQDLTESDSAKSLELAQVRATLEGIQKLCEEKDGRTRELQEQIKVKDNQQEIRVRELQEQLKVKDNQQEIRVRELQ